MRVSKAQLPHLTVVTFSGAHATGKTTLLGDLVARLEDENDTSIFVAESCSSELFRRIQTGSVRLPDGAQVPKTYDDLNRLGLRAFFQRSLPDALSFEVESAVLRAVNDHPYAARTYVLVDRWFVDILAYTVTESTDEKLHAEVRDLCASRLHELQTWMLTHAKTLRVLNVFVPVKASNFKVSATSKFRATGDRGAWETACLSRWKELIPGRRGMLPLSSSDRKRRVAQIVEHLLVDPSKSTT